MQCSKSDVCKTMRGVKRTTRAAHALPVASKYFLCALLALASVFFSCSKKSDDVIQFDNSEPLALAPDVTWAVVLDPYAAYRDTTSWDSRVVSYCRKGDILQVTGSATIKGSGTWYKFNSGWLPESAVRLYDNRFRAETAAKQLVE